MVDAIIVLIVIVLLIFALKGTLKHFKGESPCCGGGSGLIKTEIEEKVLDHPAIASDSSGYPRLRMILPPDWNPFSITIPIPSTVAPASVTS